MNKEFS